MEWIEINNEDETTLPQVQGKYVLKTLTIMQRSVHKVEAFFSIKFENGKWNKKFSTSNQIVTHWLKED